MKKAILVILILGLGLIMTRSEGLFGRALEATLLLSEMAKDSDSMAERSASHPVRRQEIRFETQGQIRQGDLYTRLPPSGESPPGRLSPASRGALVLVPGLTPEGRDDRRLIALATSLARARFAVLVPEIPTLRLLAVSSADAVLIGEFADFLFRRENRPIGLAGISYATGPVILAALEMAENRQIGFILALGGYYSLPDVINFFTTGHYRLGPKKPWIYRTPNAYGKWVFALNNTRYLENESDRAILESLARRKMTNPQAPVEDMAGQMSAQGRSLYALLVNDDPEKTKTLLAAIPEKIAAEIDALDLAKHDLSRLAIPLILIHGRDDAIIPFSESVALSKSTGGRVDLFLPQSLAHVSWEPAGLKDYWTLWRACYALLSRRDAMAPE